DARHFRRERIQLVHHGVNGVFQFEDLALNVNGNLFRQVTVGDGSRHGSNVPDLVGEVAGHKVDTVRQILPGTADILHQRLAAELSFGTHFASHSGYFRS